MLFKPRGHACPASFEGGGGPFFLWRIGGPSIPRFAHKTYESADEEVNRLLDLFPDAEFLILGPIARVQKKAVLTPMVGMEIEGGRSVTTVQEPLREGTLPGAKRWLRGLFTRGVVPVAGGGKC